MIGKVLKQYWDVFSALLQGLNFYGHHVEAVKQIFTEMTLLNKGLNIFMGGGNHPYIDIGGLRGTDRIYGSLLQYAQ